MTQKSNSAPARPKIKKTESRSQTPSHTSKTNPTQKQRSSEEYKQRQKLWQDGQWIAIMLLVVFTALSLAGFSMKDPAWSRSIGDHGQLSNFGGIIGAYLADVNYYLFGLSAWWLIVAGLVWLYRHFRPIQQEGHLPYLTGFALIGLVSLLMTSPALEFLLFKQKWATSLPHGTGGLIGSFLGSLFAKYLGFSGSLLVLSFLFLIGISLLMQISWLDFFENIGSMLERGFEKIKSHQTHTISKHIDVPETRRTLHEASEILAAPISVPQGSSSNRKVAVSVATPVVPVASPALNKEKKNLETGLFNLPPIDLLSPAANDMIQIDEEKLRETAQMIEQQMATYGIEVQVVAAVAGPVITRYEIKPAQGVKGSQIVGLSKDLARALMVQSVRVVETIAGKSTMGIELPSEVRQNVLLREILASNIFNEATSKLTVALGKDIAGVPMISDLAKMPHVLVAGMTGSGKSVGVNAMIMSILFKATPDEVRMIMIDPKAVEFMMYKDIPHLLCPVITDMSQAGHALNWCVAEMEKRNRLMSQIGVKNLAGFNEKIEKNQKEGKPIPNPFSLTPDEPEPLEKLPQIVVVIDELADLMMVARKEVEEKIMRIGQKARSAGIHMIIATQRPSADVVTGLIKANVPTRMAFTVQSKIDSRIILDQMGAESLLRMGDMLYSMPGDSEPTRLQSPYASDDEIQAVADFLKEQAEPNYIDGILTGEATLETQKMVNPTSQNSASDELFDQAVALVLETRKTSISFMQRHFKIGYNRAANLMQELENAGIVSPAEVGGARKILARKDQLD